MKWEDIEKIKRQSSSTKVEERPLRRFYDKKFAESRNRFNGERCYICDWSPTNPNSIFNPNVRSNKNQGNKIVIDIKTDKPICANCVHELHRQEHRESDDDLMWRSFNMKMMKRLNPGRLR